MCTDVSAELAAEGGHGPNIQSNYGPRGSQVLSSDNEGGGRPGGSLRQLCGSQLARLASPRGSEGGSEAEGQVGVKKA